MRFLVPFDGSKLAEAALLKARRHAIALEETPRDIVQDLLAGQGVDIVAVSVVPDGRRYAREAGWIRGDEEFSVRRVVEVLHRQVADIAPGATFDYERVDGSASAGTIGNALKRKADEHDADIVFIGSENAGRIVTPVTSVGGTVSAEDDYDVCIVRHPLPPDVERRVKSNTIPTD